MDESNLVVTVLGSGGAWAPVGIWQNQVMLEIAGLGRKYLIDASGHLQLSMEAAGVDPALIRAVIVTHLHGDHIDGLEWLGFRSKVMSLPNIDLFLHPNLKRGLTNIVEAKMGNFDEKEMTLSSYFNVWTWTEHSPVLVDKGEGWELTAKFIPVPHGIRVKDFSTNPSSSSYAVLIKLHDFNQDRVATVLFSSDCRYCPEALEKTMREVGLIFHDASPFGGVHAKASELLQYPESIRSKMVLYHCATKLPEASQFMDQAATGSVYRVNYSHNFSSKA